MLKGLSLRRNRPFLLLFYIMVKQYLPHYTRNFLEKTDWKQKKSKHYSFHFFSGSVAEKEIDFIIERQEKAYRKILNFLNLPEPTNVIEYYFYPDAETKQKLDLKCLTNREREVLKLFADGFGNPKIADELFISIRTVETHKTNIMQKLKLKTTVDLVKFAIRNNIIEV